MGSRDLGHGIQQLQGRPQLVWAGNRLLEQKLQLQAFLGGILGLRNRTGQGHRRVAGRWRCGLPQLVGGVRRPPTCLGST